MKSGTVEFKKIAVIIDGIKDAVSCLFDKVDTMEKELKLQEEIKLQHNEGAEVQRKEKSEVLKEEMKVLKEDVRNLKEKYEKLKELEEDLLIGEMAILTEKEIVNYMLKGTGVQCKTDFITIRNIEDALYGRVNRYSDATEIFTSKIQKNKAKTNIKELKDVYHIGGGMFRAIKSFKTCRNFRAHPNIDIADLRARLAKIQHKHKETIEEMIKIYEAFQ
uniref:Uncharacterized protein n=1 Tax=Amphimedon queenslandica TaxID=400682 RepID=A0A1X7T674_AMPQE